MAKTLCTLSDQPELAKLIELVNYLPADKEMPFLLVEVSQEIGKQAEAWLEEATRLGQSGQTLAPLKSKEQLVSAYQWFFKQFPDEIQSYIGPIEINTVNVVLQRYEYLFEAFILLRSIAHNNFNFQSKPFAFFTSVTLRLEIDENGRITEYRSLFLEELIKINVTRIRECPICKKLFWAPRKDKAACSNECSNVLRQRKWRNGYSEQYKFQRYTKAEADKK